MKRLFTLTVLLILLITAVSVHGQDDIPLTETYRSGYFYLQFDYPAGWEIIEQLGGPLLVNYEYRNSGPRGLGETRMQFLTSGDLIARGLYPDTSGPVEFLDSLRPVFDRDDENSMEPASALTIGESAGARAEGLFRDTPTIFLAVSGPADAFTLVTGEANEEELADFEPLFMQIAASTRYEPPQFADPLPTITSANAALIARYMSLYVSGQGRGQTESVAFSPDGTLAVSALGQDGTKLWDVATGDRLRHIEDLEATSIAFAPDGSQLAATIMGGDLAILILETGKVVTIETENYLRSVAYTPDGTQLVIGDDKGVIQIWDATSLTVNSTLAEGADSRISALAVFANHVAATHVSGKVALYDLSGNASPALLPIGEARAAALAFSADGTRLAVLAQDSQYTVFEVASGDVVLTARAGDDNVSDAGIALNGDGSVLAVTTSGDRLIWLIDVATGDLLAELNQGGDEVSALAFNADGTLLLAGGFYDETLTLWAVP